MTSTDTPTASTTLTALLTRAQAFAPEYGGLLSTHLPMALVALQALGADAPRMEAFFATISARLSPAPAATTAPADWLAVRGDRAAFASLRAYFVRAITNHGREAWAATLDEARPL